MQKASKRRASAPNFVSPSQLVLAGFETPFSRQLRQPVELTTNSYTAFPQTVYNAAGMAAGRIIYNEGVEGTITPGGVSPDDSNSFLSSYYSISSDDNYLTGTTTNVYDTKDTTKYTTSTTTYNYDNEVHQQVTRSYHTDSRGNTEVVRTKYPADYSTGNAVIDSMVNRNMQAEAIEKYDTLKNAATSVNAITQAQLNQYEASGYNFAIMPAKISTLSVLQPLTNFTPSTVTSGALTSDSRYVQMISFDNYDNNNNITQYTARNATPVSILWNYLGELPTAQVKNSSLLGASGYNNIYYTSFEADNKGNWTYSGTPVYDPTAPTGTLVYPLTAGSITTGSLPSGQAFVLSFWSNNGPPSVTVYGGGALTDAAYQTYNGWTYYEYQVPAGSATITISGSPSIDELRLYPATAEMTTYAYDPSGVRSISDTKGSNSYFEYDYLQRLQNVKDWSGNIDKSYTYHLYNQTVGNQLQSNTFTRNNCPAGTTAQSTIYSVPANTYHGISQASANAEAIFDLNTNGQMLADNPAVCGCPVTMQTFTLSNSTGITGFQVTFSGISTPYSFPTTGPTSISVPVGTYATVYVGPVGSGTHTFSLTGQTTQSGVHSATFNSVTVTSGTTLTLSIQ
jgi:hypothetical protein